MSYVPVPIAASKGGTGQTSASASIQPLLDAIGTTQGQILYYNGTDWVALGTGTDGHFLKTQGTGANPTWAAPSGSNPSNYWTGEKTITTAGSPASGTATPFVSFSTTTNTTFSAWIYVLTTWKNSSTAQDTWNHMIALGGKNLSGTATGAANTWAGTAQLGNTGASNLTFSVNVSGTNVRVQAAPTWTSGTPDVIMTWVVLTNGTVSVTTP